jgi:crotonobetainyl-CoA:carnitine CoA-transferase CaiB-like acyl-CoA transferase
VTDHQFKGLVHAAGLAELLDDPELRTPEDRQKNGGKAMRQVGPVLAKMTTAEVVARLAEHDVPCAPIVALDDVADEPQVIASASLEVSEDPTLGRLRQPRPAAQFLAIDEPARTPAPVLGQHTDDVLEDMGFTADERAALRAEGAVG